jgi:hypothetical protein
MKCRRVQLQLLDFSFGRLEAAAAAAVAAHLERCADCRRVLKREQRTASMLGGLSRAEPRTDAWPAIEAALRADRAPRRRPWAGWQPVVWVGGLAAAAALVVQLSAPLHPAPSPNEPDMMRALSPSVAAGLPQERSTDPLVKVQSKLDRLMDHMADEGS